MKNLVKDTIHANGIDIGIYTQDFENEFISLTDIARYKSDEPKDAIKNWMRSKDTIEFLGLWEKLHNSNFKGVEFDSFRNQAGSNAFTIEGCFVTCYKGEIIVEEFLELSEYSLDRIIQNILSLKLIAFNASNLVESFCNPPLNDGVAFQLVKTLFSALENNCQPKTKMLFMEWKQLFNLAHDDISKQQAIIDRKKSLEILLDYKFTNRDDEYLALYALQTAYAIIIKTIAFSQGG